MLILRPELKVRTVFRREVSAARQALLQDKRADSDSSSSDAESAVSESSKISLSPTRSLTRSLSNSPARMFPEMEVDLENGQIIEVQLEIFKLNGMI